LKSSFKEEPKMYPLKFEPIYKELLWGGRELAKKGRELPDKARIAESWELSVREGTDSIISNGELQGEKLSEVIKKFGKDIIGTELDPGYIERFPILIKIIDANKDLSIQVHPPDTYSRKNEEMKSGKHETWVILGNKKD